MRLRRPPILGPHVVGKRLWLLVAMVLFAVAVMRVRVIGRSDVFHAVDGAAFGAAFDGAVAGHLLGGVSDWARFGVVGEWWRDEGGRERQGGRLDGWIGGVVWSFSLFFSLLEAQVAGLQFV